MNITEAIHWINLSAWLLGTRRGPDDMPTNAKAQEAAEYLADRAAAALRAGPTARDIREAWPVMDPLDGIPALQLIHDLQCDCGANTGGRPVTTATTIGDLL